MSLIRCFECKKKVSNIVDVCPHCGYPMNKDFIKDFNEIEKQIKKQEKQLDKKKKNLKKKRILRKKLKRQLRKQNSKRKNINFKFLFYISILIIIILLFIIYFNFNFKQLDVENVEIRVRPFGDDIDYIILKDGNREIFVYTKNYKIVRCINDNSCIETYLYNYNYKSPTQFNNFDGSIIVALPEK